MTYRDLEGGTRAEAPTLKALVLALTVVTATGVAHAQPRPMDRNDLARFAASAEPPQVILLTFGVGDQLFEKWGHGALCLEYAAPDVEPVCFNYGVTDFDSGGELAWNFLRGRQRFWVEPETWSELLEFYVAEDRDIWAQTLPLAPAQARDIEHRLLFDIEEAHREYVYDHFADNCTTRLRDMIDEATGGALRRGTNAPYPLTYRQLAHQGFAELAPLVALTDFVLGRRLDENPTVWQAMFHPQVLREHVAAAFGVPPRAVSERHGAPFPTHGSTARVPAFLIALAFALPLLLATWRRRFQRIALAWATLYLATWGIVIWTVVAISSIGALRWNEAVFVLMPLDAALPFLSAKRRRDYARVRVAVLLLVSTLCAVGVFHQPLWIPILSALMPIAIVAFDLPHQLLGRTSENHKGGADHALR